MALSSSTPNGAPRGNFSGLLRAASCRRRASRARLAGSAAANSPACCVAREFVPNIEPVARGRRWWQRAYEPTLWQATVVVRPMRQHSCHRAAAWSTAGALVDGNGRRAGRSRTRRAGAGAIRRLPRCAAPRHTSSRPPLLAHSTRVPATSLTAAQVAGRRAAATTEHSASGRSAHRVRGGTACLCRLCSRVYSVRLYSENALSGAASLAPGQPRDLMSARTSAPTRMASGVLCSRYEFWSEFWRYVH